MGCDTEGQEEVTPYLRVISYGRTEREWLDRVGKHYLQNATPGCLFCVGVFGCHEGLFGEDTEDGILRGLCLVSRPIARMLPQDGTVGEITRMVLTPDLPYGTASEVLRFAADRARERGMIRLIAYHDRTRHTGCIYKKAGFRKAGTYTPTGKGWASRPINSDVSARYEPTSKRRWELIL